MQYHQTSIRQSCRLFGGMFFALLLTACGSGGGGGDGGGGDGSSSSSGSNTLSYSGITSPAAVTPDNAGVLSGGAILVGDASGSIPLVWAVSSETSPPAKVRSVTASTAIKKALGRLDYTASSGAFAGVTESGILPGTCAVSPGTASYNLSWDDVTDEFSGTISFNGYCEDDETLTGEVSFSGNINLLTDEITALSFSTLYLMVASGSDNFTLAGSFAYTEIITDVSEKLSMTFVIRDGAGKIYRVENYFCVLTHDALGIDHVSISGRFYHPDYGYVDILSTSDFLFTGASDYPYAGVLEVSGSGKAILTAHGDAPTFEVKADTNGDGFYETGPTVYRWDSL